MHRLVLLVLALSACATSKPPEAKGPPPIPKRIALSWGQEQKGDTTDVFLQITDETGKQVSYPVGTYPGVCAVKEPAPDSETRRSAWACLSRHRQQGHRGSTRSFSATRSSSSSSSSRRRHPNPDPMAREEVMTRVKAPGGAAIQIGTWRGSVPVSFANSARCVAGSPESHSVSFITCS